MLPRWRGGTVAGPHASSSAHGVGAVKPLAGDSLLRTPRERLIAAALFVVVLGVFAPHLGNAFVWDDHGFLAQNPAVTGADGWGAVFSRDAWYAQAEWMSGRVLYYRPALTAVARGLWWVGGGSPVAFHVAGLMTHLVAVGLLFALLIELGEERASAAAVTALFAVHPLVGEVTYWASAIGEQVVLVSVLVALLAIRRARLEPTGRRRMLALVGLASTAAVFVKETGVLVAVLVTAEALRAPRSEWGRRLRPTIAAWAPVAVYLLARAAFVGGTGTGVASDLASRTVRALAILAVDVRMLVWPLPVSPQHPEPVARALAAVAGALLLLAGAAMAAILARRRPRDLFWVGWMTIPLAPALLQVFLSRETGMAVAERYLYLSLAPALVLAARSAGALGERFVPRHSWLPLAGLAAFVVPGAATTWRYGRAWNGDEAWANATLDVDPGSPTALRVRAAAALAGGEPERAADLSRKILEREPGRALNHLNLGQAYRMQGRLDAAAASFALACQIEPGNATARLLLADTLRDSGRLDSAGAEYEAAARLAPSNVEARVGYGTWLYVKGRHSEALQQWAAGLALRPDSCELQFNAGMALVALGRKAEAAAHLERFLRGCEAAFSSQAGQARAWLGER